MSGTKFTPALARAINEGKILQAKRAIDAAECAGAGAYRVIGMRLRLAAAERRLIKPARR